MSRIGKQPITIPEKTDVRIADGVLFVKGPLGEVSRPVRSEVQITISADKVITLAPAVETPFSLALWGTYGSHIRNMIKGVHQPYEKKLIIEGVGYKVEPSGTNLILSLGFSHKVPVVIPANLKVVVEKNSLTISGIDKEAVGQFAAQIRLLKKPEPYKGKGIRYSTEVIRRKQGKKSA